MSKPALIISTARRWNVGRSSRGQAEQPRDHEHRERERELAHEVAALAAVDELVDALVDDAARRARVSHVSIALRLNACCTSPR